MLTDSEITALTLSVKVALTATALSLPLAVFTGFFMARVHFRGKTLLDTLLLLPLVVPPVVIGYLLLITLSPVSPLGEILYEWGLNPSYKWQGAALASAIMAFPLMVRSIRQAFESEATQYRESAASLGLPPLTVFWRISLPLALPGVITGAILGFARAVGEFGATITFAANIPGATQTLPLALYSAAQSPGGEAPALRLALLCFIPAIASLLISAWLSRRAQARAFGK